MNALYELTKTKSLKDPNGLLDKNPWVVTNEIAFDNIGACFAIIKADGTIGLVVRHRIHTFTHGNCSQRIGPEGVVCVPKEDARIASSATIRRTRFKRSHVVCNE